MYNNSNNYTSETNVNYFNTVLHEYLVFLKPTSYTIFIKLRIFNFPSILSNMMYIFVFNLIVQKNMFGDTKSPY